MMPEAFAQGASQLDSVVHFIQLAIAPVFLREIYVATATLRIGIR